MKLESMRHLLLTALLACFVLEAADASLEFPTADGVAKKPLELAKDSKGAVLIFFLHDCPICNAYAPELERLRAEYEPKGFAFYLVQTDAALSADVAKKHATEYGLKMAVLLDGTNKLAKLCGAWVTPQVAVVGADQKTLYLGRIDDLFADYGKRRAAPTVRDLRAALDAIAAGQAVPAAKGPAVGCFIPGTSAPEDKKHR